MGSYTSHLIQSPISAKDFDEQNSRLVSNGDKIFLIGDATFSLLDLVETIIVNDITVYVINIDISARALQNLLMPELKKKLNVIDFDQFVIYTIESKKIISW